MKRLLAMLMSALFSAFNNVDYQASSNIMFSPTSYYYLESTDVPDYRSMYNGNPSSSKEQCVKSSAAVTGVRKITSSNSSSTSYWIVAEDMDLSRLSGYGDSYTFTSEQSIIAPRKCKVITHSSSGGGHYMDLITMDNMYRFHIDNMERWYCCRNKDDLPNTTDSWTHTLDIYNEVISDGYLIGYAQVGTTFSIYKNDGGEWVPITIYDYYNR